jgi:hypothetical protein
MLGNGFSIHWNYRSFHYSSLFDDANFDDLSVPKHELFDKIGTRDFERVIEQLESAADLSELYDTLDDELPETFRADAQVIRNGLGEAIARRHPLRAQAVSDEEVTMARAFLRNFEQLFTINYDLLLYWVVNRDVPGSGEVPKRDGSNGRQQPGHENLFGRVTPPRGRSRSSICTALCICFERMTRSCTNSVTTYRSL